MNQLIDYAKSFLGTPYKWGGSTPEGIDCSGLVQAILKAVSLDPPGDQNAQALYNHFEIEGTRDVFGPGALIFFGKGPRAISHIAFCVDAHFMIEAAGGDHTTVDITTAIKQEAFVKLSLITRRKDFVAMIMPEYPEWLHDSVIAAV